MVLSRIARLKPVMSSVKLIIYFIKNARTTHLLTAIALLIETLQTESVANLRSEFPV